MYTPGPLKANIIATKDGMYSIRDAQGERVGLAFTCDDALLWSQAHALLAACEKAKGQVETYLAMCGPHYPSYKPLAAIVGTLQVAIAAATKETK
jgi:hypothetical protein